MHFGVCLRGRGWMCHVGTKLVFFFSRSLVPFLECYARDHNSGPREQSETGNSVKNTGSVGCFGVTFIWPARLPFVSPGGMKTYRKKRFTSARFAFWRDFLFPLQTFCLQFRVVVVFFLFAGSIFLYFLLFLINLSYLVGFYFTYLTGYAFSN